MLAAEHVELILDEPDAGDPPDGVVRLWSIGEQARTADLQRLLAGAGISSVVLTTEVLEPNTTETTADPRTLAAYHEAGHAVAGCMRGSILRSVRLGAVAGDGLTSHSGNTWDNPFATYAGPWAETRYSWGDRPVAEDEEGLSFADRLFDVFLGGGAGDREVLSEHFASYAGLAAQLPPEISAGDLERATKRTWTGELEAVWPAIETVATRLLAGAEITHASVNALLEAC